MKRTISLILAIAILCALLCTGAFAAGTTETVKKNGFTITLDNVLGKETRQLDGQSVTVCQIPATGSKLIVKEDAPSELYSGIELLGYALYNGDYLGPSHYGVDTEGSPREMVLGDLNGDTFFSVSDYTETYIYFEFSDGNAVNETPKPAEPAVPTEPTEPATPTDPAKPADTAKPAQEAKPADTTKPAATANAYTVKQGDTMAVIALNNYGSYAYANKLQAANSAVFAKTGGKLNAGMVLTLPEKLGNAKRLSVPVAATGETLYTVKNGDCLWNIAYKTYGNGELYKSIYTRNKDRIASNYMIYVGQVIVLPAKPAPAANPVQPAK